MRLTAVTLCSGLLAALPQGVAAQESVALRSSIAPGGDTTADDAAGLAPRRTIVPETDPYAALGIRAGGFILYPSLTTRLGYTTNADAAAGGAGAGFGALTPELLVQSDWARHEATLRLRGEYEQFLDGRAASPSGSAEATARVDIADGWTGDLAAGYAYEQQSTSSPDFPAGADAPPGVHNLDASAALSGHATGRGVFTVEGRLARSLYEDATGGLPVDQGDRNNTRFGARLRAGYEVTASLTPFVEGEVTRRAYDRTVDNDGRRRSSVGTAFRAGIAFDHDPLLTGDIAVGAAREDFDDPTLAALHALTFDGSLTWAPTALTTVTFDATTALNPSANPASSGSVVHDGSVELAYAWRRNVTLTGIAGVNHERFQGTGLTNRGYRAGVGATWKINRTLHLTAGYLHEWLESSDPSRTYQADTVRLEMRVRR